jgi:hypothetical protein
MNAHQTAYQASRYEADLRILRDAEPIADALAAGRFAVIYRAPYYCPRTDAPMGSRSHMLASFNNREDADAYAADQCGYLDEFDVFVLPALPRQALPDDFNDIDF